MDEGLWKVAAKRPAGRIDLLRVESNVVRAMEKAVHQRRRLVDAAAASQSADQPERTVQEASFAARHPVSGAVAVDEVAAAKETAYGVDRSLYARTLRVAVADNREHEQVCIHIVAV